MQRRRSFYCRFKPAPAGSCDPQPAHDRAASDGIWSVISGDHGVKMEDATDRG